MKIENLGINIPKGKAVGHLSSEEDPSEYKFSNWMEALRFIEDYITSNNMEIISITVVGDEKWGFGWTAPFTPYRRIL